MYLQHSGLNRYLEQPRGTGSVARTGLRLHSEIAIPQSIDEPFSVVSWSRPKTDPILGIESLIDQD